MKYKILLIFALSIITSFFYCRKKDENGFKIYTIKANNHSFFRTPDIIDKKKIEFEFVLNESAFNKHVPDTDGVSKIWGGAISLNPRENSARLGFDIDKQKNKIILYAFVHDEGEMIYEPICDAEINKIYNCVIENQDSVYFFNINYGTYTKKINKSNNKEKFIFQLYPYIGGIYTFNKDFTIKIKQK
jgi:hypothetical protein